MFKLNQSKVSQGSIGLSAAILYYQYCGYNISIPLVDNQYYDLIIEKIVKYLQYK